MRLREKSATGDGCNRSLMSAVQERLTASSLRPKCNCLPLQWSAVTVVTAVSQQRSEML